LVPLPARREGAFLAGSFERKALLRLLLRLEALGGMQVAEAMHVYRLDRYAGTAFMSVAHAHFLAAVFFALTPLVEGEELSTHGV